MDLCPHRFACEEIHLLPGSPLQSSHSRQSCLQRRFQDLPPARFLPVLTCAACSYLSARSPQRTGEVGGVAGKFPDCLVLWLTLQLLVCVRSAFIWDTCFVIMMLLSVMSHGIFCSMPSRELGKHLFADRAPDSLDSQLLRLYAALPVH
jgi:hypothetical protein